MSFFGASTSGTMGSASTATEKDIEVADPPTDSISSMAFSPSADYLAVGSWDNNVCTEHCITRRSTSRIVFDGPQCSGPDLRSGSEWTNTGQGDVLSSRPRTQRMLEQGACTTYISTTQTGTGRIPTAACPIPAGWFQDPLRWRGQCWTDVRRDDWSGDASRPARRADPRCAMDRVPSGRCARYWQLGQDGQGEYGRLNSTKKRSPQLSCTHAVLGLAHTEPCVHCVVARALLYTRRCVPPDGRWHRRASHTSVQPPKPNHRFQSRSSPNFVRAS